MVRLLKRCSFHQKCRYKNLNLPKVYSLTRVRSAHQDVGVTIAVQINLTGQAIAESAETGIDLRSLNDLTWFFINAVWAPTKNEDRSPMLIVGSSDG